MTCLSTQSAHRLTVLGTYSQDTLPINLAKNISFEIMTSILHEKWIPRRWLMIVVAFDSMMTLCHFFETASLIPSRIALAVFRWSPRHLRKRVTTNVPRLISCYDSYSPSAGGRTPSRITIYFNNVLIQFPPFSSASLLPWSRL